MFPVIVHETILYDNVMVDRQRCVSHKKERVNLNIKDGL